MQATQISAEQIVALQMWNSRTRAWRMVDSLSETTRTAIVMGHDDMAYEAAASCFRWAREAGHSTTREPKES